MLDCTRSFSLWWTMVKMTIYTQKCEQKWLKINNRGVGLKMSWVEKIEKLTMGGGGGGGGGGEEDDHLGPESTWK